MAQVCPQPPALERIVGKNCFTAEQEIDLGDAMGDNLAHEFPLVDDPALTAHLEELGTRLIRFLPPNNLRFRYFLIDWPEVNAFSLSGGRIYVARKMVALTRSDDELAGVLAHEMGHIVTHQQATEITRALRVIGVTQVGNRPIFRQVPAASGKRAAQAVAHQRRKGRRPVHRRSGGIVCDGARRIRATGLCGFVGPLQRDSRKCGKLVLRSAGTHKAGAKAIARVAEVGFDHAGGVRPSRSVIECGIRLLASESDCFEHGYARQVTARLASESETGAAIAARYQ